MRKLLLLGAFLSLGTFAHASIIVYSGPMSGANENPPTGSPATGNATVTVDTVANTITFSVTFAGLSSLDNAAHIHCCVAMGGNTGVATALPALPGFPLNATSGTFNASFNLLDPTFYNPTFVTNNGGTAASAEAVLLAGMAADQTYFNIHTSMFSGGEIRAFLQPVPEPATFLLTGLALLGVAIYRRKSG